MKKCNAILAQPDMSARGIIRKSNVEFICTPDDLKPHGPLAANPDTPVAVLPTFRPDKAIRADNADFSQYAERLECMVGYPIEKMEDMRRALRGRIEYFEMHGCQVSDHTLESADTLGKAILYSLNPADNGIIGTVMGAFQTDSAIPGKIQQDSAWWFNDHKQGMS